jgi:hypothetical protein
MANTLTASHAPPLESHESLPLGAIVRRIILILLASLAFLLQPVVDDPVLKNAVPLFILLIVIQLAPVLWPRDVDIGSPPVFFGVGGMIAGMGTAASLAGFIAEGQISLAWVGALGPEQLEALVQKVLLACCLGTICYYVGFFHPSWGAELAKRFPVVSGRNWNVSRLKAVSLVFTLVFVVSYAYFQTRLGVSLLDPTQMRAGKSVWRDDPYLTWMLRGIYLGALPGFLYFAHVLRRPGLAAVILVTTALVLLSYLSLRVGQRGMAFAAFLPPIIVFHYMRKRVPVSVLLLGLLLAVTLSNAMLAWRYNAAEGARSYHISQVHSPESESLTGRMVSTLQKNDAERKRFHVLAFLFNEFPANRDYLYGQSWLGLLVLPIPRWLLPEKWEYFIWRDSAIMLVIVGSPNPTPLLPLLYVNFSWLGIILGLLLWGVFHRALYEWMLAASKDPTVIIYYTMIVVYFAPTLSGLSAALQYVIPVWLALRFIAPPERAVPWSALPLSARFPTLALGRAGAKGANGAGAAGLFSARPQGE